VKLMLPPPDNAALSGTSNLDISQLPQGRVHHDLAASAAAPKPPISRRQITRIRLINKVLPGTGRHSFDSTYRRSPCCHCED